MTDEAYTVNAIRKKDLAALTAALEAGADPNGTSAEGASLLRLACFENQVPMVEVLLYRGANVHREDRLGWTAFDWVAISRSAEVFHTIFSAACISAINSPASCPGWTPLHLLAVYGSSENMARVLTYARHCNFRLFTGQPFKRIVIKKQGGSLYDTHGLSFW
jgi:ankyrin repeat protein